MNIKENTQLYKKNLLLISMFVFFYYYSGASIDGIKFNGLSASFKNTDALIHMLWATWLYFILRYTQYFITYGLPIVKKTLTKPLYKRFLLYF